MNEQQDQLMRWEKWPVVTLFLAQGFYAWQWYGKDMMPPIVEGALPWLYPIFGVAAALSLEGVMVATIMGTRAGRRSWWSIATIVTAAFFGAMVALDAHGAFNATISIWLHACYAVVIVMYLMHLAEPRSASTLHAKLTQLRLEAEQRDKEIARLRGDVANARSIAQNLELERAALTDALASEQQRTTLLLAEQNDAVIEVSGTPWSLRRLATVLDVPLSTLSRKLNSNKE